MCGRDDKATDEAGIVKAVVTAKQLQQQQINKKIGLFISLRMLVLFCIVDVIADAEEHDSVDGMMCKISVRQTNSSQR